MCDFRKIIGVIIDGKQIDINTESGHFTSFPPPEEVSPGLYCVGASGCGMFYCDGKYWYDDYDRIETDVHKNCKYIVDGYKGLLNDVWDYKP